ncbi:hypothetical protein EVJ58_g9314 [Rhodofomes roseus]|uniref:Methyltransferase family protein n=1 Tax=Rhodofomes roseus TaxID=34475 RepID=A0A4Y9XU69_9APHY|nr:hypothetical protein EVJ58_g9314 [Rhodofomes roseus]
MPQGLYIVWGLHAPGHSLYIAPGGLIHRARRPDASCIAPDASDVAPDASYVAPRRLVHTAKRPHTSRWEAFDIARAGGPFDIVLTSETIYRPESLPALVRVMRSACAPADGLAEGTARMTIRDTLGEDGRAPYLCLVAAKRVYFGVGGGVAEFVKAVEEHSVEEGASAPSPQQSSPSSKVETVWERTEGVKRIVMRVFWGQS